MLSLRFDPDALPERPTVLALGAHSDDIEIGCGGTLLQLAAARPDIEVTWVVLSATEERVEEAHAGAAAFAGSVASLDVIVEGFRDKYLAHDGEAVRDFFEQLNRDLDPDIVLTHRRGDSHQDHRFVCELTWNTFRDHLILEYEIPKYDGDLVSPNLFVPITEEVARRKVDAIMSTFATQRSKPWFTEDLFLAMLRLRGMEVNSPTRFAEAFTCRKVVLELSDRPAEAAARPSISLVAADGRRVSDAG